MHVIAVATDSASGGSSGQAYAFAVYPGLNLKIRLIAAYDTRILSDGRSFGIVTAYCNRYTLCPDWVNQIPVP